MIISIIVDRRSSPELAPEGPEDRMPKRRYEAKGVFFNINIRFRVQSSQKVVTYNLKDTEYSYPLKTKNSCAQRRQLANWRLMFKFIICRTFCSESTNKTILYFLQGIVTQERRSVA
jgi:hypothetical protein